MCVGEKTGCASCTCGDSEKSKVVSHDFSPRVIYEIDEENWAEWFVKVLVIGSSNSKRFQCCGCGTSLYIHDKNTNKVDEVVCPVCGGDHISYRRMLPKLDDFVALE